MRFGLDRILDGVDAFISPRPGALTSAAGRVSPVAGGRLGLDPAAMQ